MTQYVQYSESYSENWMTDMNEWQWKEIKQLLSRSGGLRVHVETFLINDVTMEFRFKFITLAWFISSRTDQTCLSWSKVVSNVVIVWFWWNFKCE